MGTTKRGERIETEITAGCERVLIKRRARVNGWTRARRKRFLEALAETCNVKHSLSVAEMGVSGAYQLRQRDAAFARLWADALAIGYERLEEALVGHAVSVVNDLDIAHPEASEPRRLSHAEVQSALAILKRNDELHATGARRSGKRRPTPEEVNGELTARLDRLAKRLGYL